jgi:hypothetical protein
MSDSVFLVSEDGSLAKAAGAPFAAEADLQELLAAYPDLLPVGFQKSATGLDLGFYAARSYSLRRPPRTGRRLIRSRERSATG